VKYNNVATNTTALFNFAKHHVEKQHSSRCSKIASSGKRPRTVPCAAVSTKYKHRFSSKPALGQRWHSLSKR